MALLKKLNWSRSRCQNHEEGLSDSKENVDLLPSQGRMTEFMSESKKNQTFYANCEGFYSRRIVNATDTSSLHRFIECTLFNKEDGPDPIDVVQRANIINIESSMIEISKRYMGSPDEIHFTVIWVYYYVYSNHKHKAMPLFKIFKTRHDSDQAIFLDVELNAYNGWEEYLDNTGLPESLLCVPRNGTYVCQPDSESPDLIYVISKSLRLPGRTLKNFQPFCVSLEGAIKSTCEKFNVSKAAVIKKIEDFSVFVVGVWKDKTKALRLILYSKCFGLKLFLPSLNAMPKLLMRLRDSAFMLLNTTNEMCIPSIPNDLGNISPSSVGVENHSNVSTGSKPNWDRIFSSIVQLTEMEQIESLLKTYYPVYTALKVLIAIVKLVIFIRRTACEGGVTEAVNWNLEKIQASFEKNNAGVKGKARELTSHLGKVENDREGISEAGESSQVNGTAPEMAPIGVPINGDSLSGTLYVFSSTKLPKINQGLGTIFKDFVYKAKTDRVYEIIAGDGRFLGTLYVVEENFAFAHVP